MPNGRRGDARCGMRLERRARDVLPADDHVTDGESIVPVAAVEQWRLHRETLRVAPFDSNDT